MDKKLTDEIGKTHRIKEHIKRTLIEYGVNVPDNMPFYPVYGSDGAGYADLIMKLDDGKSFSPARLKNGDFTIYFSWIDVESGDPKNIRVTCMDGDQPEFPNEMLEDIYKIDIPCIVNKIPHLKFSRISSSADDIDYSATNYKDVFKDGVHSDMIVQAEYITVDDYSKAVLPESQFDVTMPALYMRFRPTHSLNNPMVSLRLKVAVNVSPQYLYTVTIDGLVTQVKSNNNIYTNYIDLDIDLRTSYPSQWEDVSHLVEIRIPRYSYIKEIIFGNIRSGTQYKSSLYASSTIGSVERDDPFYAAQVEAIYIPTKYPLTTNTENNPYIKFNDYALNAFVNLKTILIPQRVWTDSHYFLANTKNLMYMSELTQNVTAGTTATFETLQNVSPMCAFKDCTSKFLNIKSFSVMVGNFCDGALDLEVLPSTMRFLSGRVNDFSYNFSGCVSLRHFPSIVLLSGADIANANVISNFCNNALTLTETNLDFSLMFRSVETISDFFINCNSLLTVPVLPSRVVNFGSFFLYHCTSLKHWDDALPTDIHTIGNYFCHTNTEMETMPTLSNSITSIGNYFCYCCTKLQRVINIPSNLNSIGQYFLNYCENLIELGAFGKNIASVGIAFLTGCKNLEVIDISRVSLVSGQIVFPVDSFKECPSLKKIFVPKNQKSMYVAKFTHIKADIFIEVPELTHQIKHKVVFKWLEPEYSKRHNGTMLGCPSTTVEALDGEVIDYPKEFLDAIPINIGPAEGFPKLIFDGISGDIPEDTTLTSVKVTKDLVIQAEYIWELSDGLCPGLFFVISGEGGKNTTFSFRASAYTDLGYIKGNTVEDYLPIYLRTTYSSHIHFSKYMLNFKDISNDSLKYWIRESGTIKEGWEPSAGDVQNSAMAGAEKVRQFVIAAAASEEDPTNAIKTGYEVIKWIYDFCFMVWDSKKPEENGIYNPFELTWCCPATIIRNKKTPVIFGITMSEGPYPSDPQNEQYWNISENRFFRLGDSGRTWRGSYENRDYAVHNHDSQLFLGSSDYGSDDIPASSSKFFATERWAGDNYVGNKILGCFLSTVGEIRDYCFNGFDQIHFVVINYIDATGENLNNFGIDIGSNNFTWGDYNYISALSILSRGFTEQGLANTSINSDSLRKASPHHRLFFMSRVKSIARIDFVNKFQNDAQYAKIGDSFAHNSNLEVLAPIHGIFEIGNDFCSKTKLTNMDALPNTLYRIGARFCYGCEMLEYVKIPSSVVIISENFLGNCPKLKIVDLVGVPAGSVNMTSFNNCPLLERIYVSSQEIVNYRNKFVSIQGYFEAR